MHGMSLYFPPPSTSYLVTFNHDYDSKTSTNQTKFFLAVCKQKNTWAAQSSTYIDQGGVSD